MNKIINHFIKLAKQKPGTIILPEANLDERVKKAAEYVVKNKITNIIVFGTKSDFSSLLTKSPLCQIIDINTYEKLPEFTETLYELRKEKGLTKNQAQKLILNPIYFSMVMLHMGLASGVVAGASFTTADTIRPALQLIKAKNGKQLVTGSTLMIKENHPILLFGDVSLIEKPDEKVLSEIAIANAEFMDKVVGLDPKVALLSYSTKGSAVSDSVNCVQKATRLAKRHKKYAIGGEMQVDCALDEQTAKRKGAGLKVAGKANVLIFPDLNAGNIGYKLASYLGGYTAIGPLMLNLKKPVNDLSRGSTVLEIVATICLTKLQAE